MLSNVMTLAALVGGMDLGGPSSPQPPCQSFIAPWSLDSSLHYWVIPCNRPCGMELAPTGVSYGP